MYVPRKSSTFSRFPLLNDILGTCTTLAWLLVDLCSRGGAPVVAQLYFLACRINSRHTKSQQVHRMVKVCPEQIQPMGRGEVFRRTYRHTARYTSTRSILRSRVLHFPAKTTTSRRAARYTSTRSTAFFVPGFRTISHEDDHTSVRSTLHFDAAFFVPGFCISPRRRPHLGAQHATLRRAAFFVPGFRTISHEDDHTSVRSTLHFDAAFFVPGFRVFPHEDIHNGSGDENYIPRTHATARLRTSIEVSRMFSFKRIFQVHEFNGFSLSCSGAETRPFVHHFHEPKSRTPFAAPPPSSSSWRTVVGFVWSRGGWTGLDHIARVAGAKIPGEKQLRGFQGRITP